MEIHPHCIVVTAKDMLRAATDATQGLADLVAIDSRQHVFIAYPSDDGISHVAQTSAQNR